MTETPDRLVRVAYHQPVLLFTDGSFELGFSGSFAGVGGVIFVPTCNFVAYFFAENDGEYLQLLTADSANPIAIIELIAVAFAVTLWRNHLANNSVLGFVDNDAAKFAPVKGYSVNPWMAALVEAACDVEISQRALLYWERVPSSSNIADDPSRGRAPARLPGWPEERRVYVGGHGPHADPHGDRGDLRCVEAVLAEVTTISE